MSMDVPDKILGFEWAIQWLRSGNKCRRRGWNGKGMWIALHDPEQHTSKTFQVQEMTLPFLYLRTAGEIGHLVPWLASQTDILAQDWEPA